jgi:hypothetical protein
MSPDDGAAVDPSPLGLGLELLTVSPVLGLYAPEASTIAPGLASRYAWRPSYVLKSGTRYFRDLPPEARVRAAVARKFPGIGNPRLFAGYATHGGRSGSYHYYRCSGATHGWGKHGAIERCATPQLPADEVERAVITALNAPWQPRPVGRGIARFTRRPLGRARRPAGATGHP